MSVGLMGLSLSFLVVFALLADAGAEVCSGTAPGWRSGDAGCDWADERALPKATLRAERTASRRTRRSMGRSPGTASKTYLVRGSWVDLWLSAGSRKTSRGGRKRILHRGDRMGSGGAAVCLSKGRNVKLFVQPEAGLEPILAAIRKAKKCIQILIFRLDRTEIEKALVEAVERGVAVQVLVANTNRGGDKILRRFEMRSLERGITVTRTADDLVRYHGKMLIIDEKELLLLAFNFTHLDISLSRSFAISTTNKALVAEAVRLFECDSKRTPYTAENKDFVVSPANAREQLILFIRGAKKQLLMYEMKISDSEFVKLLNEKISKGVDVRVIGSASNKGGALPTRKLPMRLHTRGIIRDGRSVFLGSQSLRKLELEARREIGIIVH